jgi:hypothetical protein
MTRTLLTACLLSLAACTGRTPRPDATIEGMDVVGRDAHDLDADAVVDARAPDASVDGGVVDSPADVPARDVPNDGPIFVDAGCNATYMRHDEQPGAHVPPDAGITWTTNPPSSGNHFDEWARWGIHRVVIPRGYWVHNLEHGGVAVLYRCNGDCNATRAQLEAVVRALEPEPQCTGSGVARRILLTEDPLLDVPVAAASWGWTYRADCVDPGSLEAFVRRRTGMAPEDVCAEGTYPPLATDR